MITEEILQVYKLLSASKMAKMKDVDKFHVIKIMHALKPIYKEYMDYEGDVQSKLQDDKFEEMRSKFLRWQREGSNTTLTILEREEVNNYLDKYNKSVSEGLKDELAKDVKVKYDRIDDKAFQSLLASNDFNIDQSTSLFEALV